MSKIPKAIHCHFDDSNRPLRIFKGRQEDLRKLYESWKDDSVESSVIKIANMPGIGKTELVRQFFRTYGLAKGAICIEFDSKHLWISATSAGLHISYHKDSRSNGAR